MLTFNLILYLFYNNLRIKGLKKVLYKIIGNALYLSLNHINLYLKIIKQNNFINIP